MANVALVYPPDHDTGPKRHHPYWDHGHDLHIAYLSLGLGYIAAHLRRHGHQVTILDGLLFGIPLEGMIERLRAGDFDVIGVALPAHETVVDGILLVEGIADCAAHVTVGGNYATFEAEAILANMPRVDSVVCGEGEETTLELVEAVERGRRLDGVAGLTLRHGNSIRRTPPRQRTQGLDELPFPDRDGTRPSSANALVPLAASRGCYADCSFCYNRGFFGSGVVVRRLVGNV